LLTWCYDYVWSADVNAVVWNARCDDDQRSRVIVSSCSIDCEEIMQTYIFLLPYLLQRRLQSQSHACLSPAS
jgi:hypothetical protein